MQTQDFSGIRKVEHYIELNDHLPQITTQLSSNITPKEKQSIKKLKKPAVDKNLGIILLNTEDYIEQCLKHLADTSTYKLADCLPSNAIRSHLQNTTISF